MDNIKGALYIAYNENTDVAPELVTKGYGEVAEEIIKTAFENNIFIYKDPKLFESLIKLESGSEIPTRFYITVAKLLAFVSQINKECEVLNG